MSCWIMLWKCMDYANSSNNFVYWNYNKQMQLYVRHMQSSINERGMLGLYTSV